jgi:hypothetical protein
VVAFFPPDSWSCRPPSYRSGLGPQPARHIGSKRQWRIIHTAYYCDAAKIHEALKISINSLCLLTVRVVIELLQRGSSRNFNIVLAKFLEKFAQVHKFCDMQHIARVRVHVHVHEHEHEHERERLFNHKHEHGHVHEYGLGHVIGHG